MDDTKPSAGEPSAASVNLASEWLWTRYGVGVWSEGAVDSLAREIDRALQAAVAQERKRCAAVSKSFTELHEQTWVDVDDGHVWAEPSDIAAAILAPPSPAPAASPAHRVKGLIASALADQRERLAKEHVGYTNDHYCGTCDTTERAAVVKAEKAKAQEVADE